MKKIWKALGITALAATVIPYRIRKDKENDTTNVDALLWQLTRRPGTAEEEEETMIDINLGFKSPLQELREEQELFTDDPEEAVPFTEEMQAAADEVQAAAEETQAAAEEAAAEVQAVAEEIEADAEARAAVEESDSDPDSF